MTRDEHMIWCKKRALEYVEIGDYHNAVTSMLSDLRKHSETADHIGIQLGLSLMMMGEFNSQEKVKKFIEGFN